MLRRLVHAFAQPLVSRMQGLLTGHLQDVRQRQAELALLLGKLSAARVAGLPDGAALRDAEFKVFSQWGEDGIIQYLISRVAIPKPYFVEFGVENYLESNTRFLLLNDNWSGLIMDGSDANMQYVRGDAIYWRHELQAVSAFITAENINELLRTHVPERDIGILSVDIDGNDYWVWRAIDAVAPRIVIAEYNSVFGPDLQVTVPYQPDFNRTKAHHSNLFWGASLAALCHLGAQKGYAFVGSNSAGNNAFFVREDCAARLRKLAPAEGYVRSRFRESRNEAGHLTYISGDARLGQILDMTVHELRRNRPARLRELV
jgi:hypothetical protein